MSEHDEEEQEQEEPRKKGRLLGDPVIDVDF